MADLADEICAGEGIRHTVVFYSLPSTPPDSPGISRARLFNQHSDRLSRLFARRPAALNGCHIRFISLATDAPGKSGEQALWLKRENWLDYTHFSPQLGALALDVLAPREVADAHPVATSAPIG